MHQKGLVESCYSPAGAGAAGTVPAKRHVTVPGATHLFEEPGALDEVGATIAWVVRTLPHARDRPRTTRECSIGMPTVGATSNAHIAPGQLT